MELASISSSFEFGFILRKLGQQSRVTRFGVYGPLTDNSWDPRNIAYKFSSLNSTSWCGARDVSSHSTMDIRMSQSLESQHTHCTMHTHLPLEWGRWHWSQCPPINEGTNFTNTVTMCVHFDFRLQCAQVVSVLPISWRQ
jgi:hypothetical protein